MPYRKPLSVLLLSLLCCAAQAQDDLAAKLQELKQAKEDTNKVILLYSTGNLYEYGNTDSALWCYNEARRLSRKLNYLTGQFRYYGNASAAHNAAGAFDKGLQINFEGVAFAESHHNTQRAMMMLMNVGNSYLFKEKWDSAIYYYNRSLPYFEGKNDSAVLELAYSNISEAYRKNNQFELALHNARRAVDISKDRDASAYVNSLYNTANVLVDMKQWDKAMEYYRTCEAECMQHENMQVLASVYAAYTEIYWKQRDFKKMMQSADRFFTLAVPVGNNMMISHALYVKGRAFFCNKMFDSARVYNDLSMEMDTQLSNTNVLKKAYRLKALLDLVQNKNTLSFEQYDQMGDSIDNEIFNQQLLHNAQELEEQYETQKKETKILMQAGELRAKKMQARALIALSALLAVIGFLSIRSYRNRQKLQAATILQLQQEKQLTATQAVLKGQDEERTRLAKDLHDGLGGLLSGVKFSFNNMKENFILTPEQQNAFSNGINMLDASIKELRTVAHNMMPESLLKFGLDNALSDACEYISRSGIHADYQSIHLKDVKMGNDISLNVYRIVQELLNNAVKHAHPQHILVQAGIEGNKFTLTVEDDGKGMDKAAMETSVGVGWASIRNRIAVLNGTLDFQSAPGKGTSVYIEFPLNRLS